ncbi:MAG: glycosyltransferase family 2 protein [Chloroflexi bacterium]|nr:glycosyltransferase family 2 protein [Chloroflexota bacterium]
MPVGPLVSVIMSFFNAERFLEQAISSILDQTYRNLEFIMVDDGSKDQSWNIASRFGQLDSRIRLLRLEKNQGVSSACNGGLKIARGKYIARMDSDDVSLPERFSRQVDFMEAHPDVGVLGCGMRYMSESGKLLGVPPQFHGDLSIRWHMLFESPFFNPTVMMRKSVMDQFGLKYDLSAIYGEEDYELWSRFLLFARGENLSEIFLHYRLQSRSLTHRYAVEQNETVTDISTKAAAAHLPDTPVSVQEIRSLQDALKGVSSPAKRQRAELMPVYFKIWDEFRRLHDGEPGLAGLERDVIAWAARMILYPLSQPHSSQALLSLTGRNWKWPFYLLKNIPYYQARRRIGW